MTQLILSDALAARVLAAAARSYPMECCGLIEGTQDGDVIHARAIHETENVAEQKERRFLVDPGAQIRLMRALRASRADIIGCFHSHPEGLPEPSAADAAEAVDDRFVWLIAGGNPRQGFRLRAFLSHTEDRRFTDLPIVATAPSP
jgi:proteasome lid subunit RPN8/RPN11